MQELGAGFLEPLYSTPKKRIKHRSKAVILQSILPPKAILLIMFFFEMYQGMFCLRFSLQQSNFAACKASVKLGTNRLLVVLLTIKKKAQFGGAGPRKL